MNKVYRTSDRIRINVDGLVFTISPLSFDQKSEIQSLAATGDLATSLKAAKLAVKYAVKDVEGLEDEDGEYRPEIDENGLTDESIDTLFNIEQNDKLAFACLNLIKSVPREFVDPHTGEKLEGVSIVEEGGPQRKKKRRASNT